MNQGFKCKSKQSHDEFIIVFIINDKNLNIFSTIDLRISKINAETAVIMVTFRWIVLNLINIEGKS